MYQVIQIHPAAPPKPAWGQPCNGCGVCCASEPCPIGILVSGRRQGACRALIWNEQLSVYRCGVLGALQRASPRWLGRKLARFVTRLIASGQGCDCALEVEPSA